MRALLSLWLLSSGLVSLPAVRASPSPGDNQLDEATVVLHSLSPQLASKLEEDLEEVESFRRRQVQTFSPSRVAGAVKDSYILTVALDLYRSMLEREGACSGHHGGEPLLAPTFSSVLLSRDGVYCAEGPAEKLPLDYWSGEALQALTEGRKADLVANSLYALGVLLYKLKHGEHEHPFGIVPGMDLGLASGNLRRPKEPIRDGSSLLELVIRSALRKERGGLAVLLELASGSREVFPWDCHSVIHGDVKVVEVDTLSGNPPVLPLPAAAGLLSSSYLFEVAKSVTLLISEEAKRGRLLIPTLSSVSLFPTAAVERVHDWKRDGLLEYLTADAILSSKLGVPHVLFPRSTSFYALGVLLSKLLKGEHFHPSGVKPYMPPVIALHVLSCASAKKGAWEWGRSSVEALIVELLTRRIQEPFSVLRKIEELQKMTPEASGYRGTS